MATSTSFENLATTFSTIDLSHNRYPDDENDSSPSINGTTSKRDRNRLIPLQKMTTDNRTTESNDDSKSFEEDQLLTSRYDHNRSKQKRLLFITNFFRVLVIVVLVPIIYFIV